MSTKDAVKIILIVAEAITELHMLGLTAERIAEVLERHVTGIRRRLVGLKAGNRIIF